MQTFTPPTPPVRPKEWSSYVHMCAFEKPTKLILETQAHQASSNHTELGEKTCQLKPPTICSSSSGIFTKKSDQLYFEIRCLGILGKSFPRRRMPACRRDPEPGARAWAPRPPPVSSFFLERAFTDVVLHTCHSFHLIVKAGFSSLKTLPIPLRFPRIPQNPSFHSPATNVAS